MPPGWRRPSCRTSPVAGSNCAASRAAPAPPGSWQRRPPRFAPPWLTSLTATEPAALVWAAAVDALEWHVPAGGVADRPGRRTAWADQLALARLYRTAFEHLGVTAGAKVSGGHGIEIWVPAAGDVTGWIGALTRSIAAVVPDLAHHGTPAGPVVLAPYSPLAAPGAPVSAPIGWEELDDPALTPDAFTVRTVPDRLAERGDLFAAALAAPRALPALDQV